MSKIYTVPELQTVLSPIFREHGVKKATLFGSYAKGAATSRSDVDLLVDSGLRGLAFFGVKEGVKVYLDESLKRFETVFPACGSSNSAIEMTMDDLEKYSGYEQWVDVCKLPEA